MPRAARARRILGLPLAAFVLGLVGVLALMGVAIAAVTLGWFVGSGGGPHPTGTSTVSPAPSPSPTDSPSPTPTPTPAPTPELSHFATLDDFKNAYVAAGGRCDNWDPSNPVAAALASGTCTAGYSVLMLTENAADARTLAASIPDDTGDQVSYGDNWVLNAVDSPQVVATLGGVLVRN